MKKIWGISEGYYAIGLAGEPTWRVAEVKGLLYSQTQYPNFANLYGKEYERVVQLEKEFDLTLSDTEKKELELTFYE